MTSSSQIWRVSSYRTTRNSAVEAFDNGTTGVRLKAQSPVDVIQIPWLLWALYEEIPDCAGDTSTMRFLTPANPRTGILHLRDNYETWSEQTAGTQTARLLALEDADPWNAGSLLDLKAGVFYAIFPPDSPVDNKSPSSCHVSITTNTPAGHCNYNSNVQ